MWSSIETVIYPVSLEEAYELSREEGHALLAGGSWLVGEKDPAVSVLIDINHLLPDDINPDKANLLIDARVTMQQIIEEVNDPVLAPFVNAVKTTCSSKNIRNQRTIGGEIAWNRADSDLLCTLRALGATLHVFTDDHYAIDINDWDGDGILTGLKIELSSLKSIHCQRFALLDSAQAFVLVSGAVTGDMIRIAIAGRTEQIVVTELIPGNFTPEYMDDLAAKAAKSFFEDHYGSIEYKKSVIQTGLQRIGAEL